MMLLALQRYFFSISKQKVDDYSAKSDVGWMYGERNFVGRGVIETTYNPNLFG